jgi:hypothetical protein
LCASQTASTYVGSSGKASRGNTTAGTYKTHAHVTLVALVF